MTLLDVDESKKILDIWAQQRETPLQDVGIRCAFSRDQIGLGSTCVADEILVFSPAGINKVAVIPDDVFVQIRRVFSKDS
ncbi:hypothetical protein D9M71_639500 [compost metagenome]